MTSGLIVEPTYGMKFPRYLDNTSGFDQSKHKFKKPKEDEWIHSAQEESIILKRKITLLEEQLSRFNSDRTKKLDDIKKLELSVCSSRQTKEAILLESLQALAFEDYSPFLLKICKFAHQSKQPEKIFNALIAKNCPYSSEITKLSLEIINKSPSNAVVIFEQLERYMQSQKLFDYHYYLAKLHVKKDNLIPLINEIHSNDLLSFGEKQVLLNKILQTICTNLVHEEFKDLNTIYETLLQLFETLRTYSTKFIFILCQLLMIKIDTNRSLKKAELMFHKRNEQFASKIEDETHIEQLKMMQEKVKSATEMDQEHGKLLCALLDVYILMENPFKCTDIAKTTMTMLLKFTNPDYKLKFVEYLYKLSLILSEFHLKVALSAVLQQIYDVYVPEVSRALERSKHLPCSNYTFLDNISLLNDIVSAVCAFKIDIYVKLLLSKTNNLTHTMMRLTRELDIVKKTPEILLQLEDCYVNLYKATEDLSLKEQYAKKSKLLQEQRLQNKDSL